MFAVWKCLFWKASHKKVCNNSTNPTFPFKKKKKNSWGIDVVLYIYINLCAGPAASSFPQCPCSSRSSVSLSCCLCVWFREEPVSSNFSMACYSVVFYWCKWCMFILIIMLPCSQCALFWFLNTWVISASDCHLVAAAMASTYIVCSNFKPLCHKVKVISVSNMYAANHG